MANIVEILVTSKNLATPGFAAAEASGRSLSKSMTQMGAVATVAIAAVAVKSVEMASTYQRSTTRLVTSAGESVKNIDMVRKGMLDMAGQVGVSANDLSKSMYYVEAAGFHGADGLTALKAAAQGAAAEGADTTQVAKALTDILVDYHLSASSAADVTSKMVEAISHGKTNLQEFSGAFANIVPAASAAGIGFTDVMSALAQMTNHGFTARRAATNLAQALRSLLNPTSTMKDAFGEFGVSTATLKEKLHGPNGLTDAMEYLSQAAGKAGKEGTPEFAAALKRLMGTAPGANAALSTVGANFKATSDTIKEVGGATKDSEGKVKGFALVQKTLGQQTDQLKAAFESLMIEIGQKLIPVLTSVVTWVNKHKDATLALLGIVVGLGAALIVYTVAVKTAAMVTAIWEGAQWLLNAALDANPITLIIIAIAALVVGIIEAYKHSKTFRDIIQDIGKVATVAFNAVVTAAEAAFNWIKDHWKLLVLLIGGPIGAAALIVIKHWQAITGAAKAAFNWVVNHWKSLTGVLSGPFSAAFRAINTSIGKITGAVQAAFKFVGRIWPPIKNLLSGPFSAAWSVISGIFGKINGAISNTLGKIGGVIDKAKGIGSSIGGFLGFAHGGTIGAAATGGTRSGLTMVGEQGPELVHLPTGSHVMSNPDTRRALSGGGGGDSSPMIVVLQMDGHTMSKLLIDPMRRTIRHIGGTGSNSVQAALGS